MMKELWTEDCLVNAELAVSSGEAEVRPSMPLTPDPLLSSALTTQSFPFSSSIKSKPRRSSVLAQVEGYTITKKVRDYGNICDFDV